MGHQAKVTSIDVIEHFAAAMKCFGEDAKTTLDGIDMEVRRALNWIQREQRDYWTGQIRRGWDEVNIARKELERKLMFYPGDDRPSCHDERLALEAAKSRFRLAQEKLEAVKRWSHRAEREVNEYIGAVQVLKSWIDFELPQAQADLARMARALEDYVALESLSGPVFPDGLGVPIGSGPTTAAGSPDEASSPHQPDAPARTEDEPSSHQTDASAKAEDKPPSQDPEAPAKSVEDEEKADG